MALDDATMKFIYQQLSPDDIKLVATPPMGPDAFMEAAQNIAGLSTVFIDSLLSDEGKQFLPFRVTAQMMSWCPSVTSNYVAKNKEDDWDAAGLMTQAWYTPGFGLKHDKCEWNWEHAGWVRGLSLDALMAETLAGNVPRRAISARPDLTPQFVKAHPDFEWVRSIMHVDAFEDPCGGCVPGPKFRARDNKENEPPEWQIIEALV